jgi:HK97 family phage prohead protease
LKQLIVVDTTARDRMMNRWGGYLGRGRPLRSSTSPVEDVALHGYAMLYDEPLAYENEIWYFVPGCFRASLMGSAPIYYQLDHDNSTRVASTRDGALKFADNEVGLAFTLDLEDSPKGAALKREVDSGRRAAVSVGVRNEESHIKMYGNHAVRVITKAELLEVSMVGAGRCANAFVATATIGSEPLSAGDKGPMFKINFAAHQLKRIKQRAAERSNDIESLKARLDRLVGKQPTRTDPQSDLNTWYERWKLS